MIALVILFIFGGICVGMSDNEYSWLGYVLMGLGALIGMCACI